MTVSRRLIQRQRTAERVRLEAKRQSILAALDEETRREHAETDLGTLICMKHTGRLNMLPGFG